MQNEKAFNQVVPVLKYEVILSQHEASKRLKTKPKALIFIRPSKIVEGDTCLWQQRDSGFVFANTIFRIIELLHDRR